MAVAFTDNPKITDDILIDFVTTDDQDEAINPYRVDSVVIYFIERSFASSTRELFEDQVDNIPLTIYFSGATPFKAVGNEDVPAWHSADTSNALIEKVEYDDDNNILTGHFRYTWKPNLTREGDYFVCWTYTPLPADDKVSRYQTFSVFGDTAATTALPTHRTTEGKYEKMLDLYLPSMFKSTLSQFDVTPDVLERYNQALAKNFTSLEDLANQLIDLLDANATHEAFLPYLANLFRMKLRSSDPTLWRRQIKTAVKQYKKKGTLDGLKEALAAAGINFVKLTQYWQIVSKSTWQENFIVSEDNQTVFDLSKNPILPVDGNNFELYIRYNDSGSYVSLDLDYVIFTNNDDGTSTMTWIPDGVMDETIDLAEGDSILVLYKIATVANQSYEDYIRSLPLSDQRDETLVSNPKKNWNVRLIAEDDPMFDALIPQRHPFSPYVVYGKVRTEFAYSENIYNMDEYNGSNRDSNLPCDIDGSFLDTCSDGLSSTISVDVEIEDLNNDRIVEANEIITDNIPFHARIHTVNYSGAINEFMLAPMEDVEILIQMNFNESILLGSNDWNHVIPDLNSDVDQLRRDMLTNSSIAVNSDTATGYNQAVILYCPDVRFDLIGVDTDSALGGNMLEILTGVNAGLYELDTPGQNTIEITTSLPDETDRGAFSFNLYNLVFNVTTDPSASVAQSYQSTFRDTEINAVSVELQQMLDEGDTPQLLITSGVLTGTYVDITDIIFDSLVLGTSLISVSSVKYQILDQDSNVLLDRSSNPTGTIQKIGYGVFAADDFANYETKIGHYIKYLGTDYKIVAKIDDTHYKVVGYTGSNASTISFDVLDRLVGSGLGYLNVKGMYIVTSMDYEAGLDVQDGANPPATPLENNSFRGNFIVEIDDNYFVIPNWDGTSVYLDGPLQDWGTSGTSVTFSILQFANNSDVELKGHIFPRWDRRGGDYVETVTTSSSMAMKMAALNVNNGGQIVDKIQIDESISWTIEWNNGETTEGEI